MLMTIASRIYSIRLGIGAILALFTSTAFAGSVGQFSDHLTVRTTSLPSAITLHLNPTTQTQKVLASPEVFSSSLQWVAIPPQTGVELNTSGLTYAIENNRENDDNSNMPAEFARLGRPAILRGYRIVPVYISERIRDPRTGEILSLTGGELELNFNTSLNRENIVVDPGRKKPSRFARKVVESLVVNPGDLPRDDDAPAGSLLYVMRDRNDIEEHLQPLIEWRRRMGWTVQILRTRQYNDRNAIKGAIQDFYDESDVPPDYIILVGDAAGHRPNDYTLAYYNVQNGADFPYETDQPFVFLEGDDLLPDAAIGRITVSSVTMIDRIVNKTINYESTPFIGPNEVNRNWQLKAAVAATDSRSGRSSIDVCNWFKDILAENGYRQINELYFDENNRQPNPTQFLTTNINNGLSFVLYRGWSDMNGFEPDDANQLRNGAALPFVMLATCNTGEYVVGNQNSEWSYTERLLTNALGGAIGAVGAAGATHTAYNNILASGTLSAPFVNDIYSQGWALQNGKIQLMKAYMGLGDINHEENRNMEAWLTEYYIFNLMGDPAVDLFTAVPKRLRVALPQSLDIGDTFFEVNVTSQVNGTPIQNAQVCLYRAGSFQHVGRTDDAGNVNFSFDPLTQGTVMVTVTGHNLYPYLESIQVGQAQNKLAVATWLIDDDENGESRGDGNGSCNPTERIELTIRLTNRGQVTADGQLRVRLEPAVSQVEVVTELLEVETNLRDGQSVDLTFVFDILGGFPNGEDARFRVLSDIAGQSFTGSLDIPVRGPQIEFTALQWSGAPAPVGGSGALWLSLKNNGATNVAALIGRLISLSPTVSVVRGDAAFAAINRGAIRRSEGLLELLVNRNHIAGNPARMAMVVEAENGFNDTVFFSIPLGQASATTPFGPDGYGYICIDDSDTGRIDRPEFDWIEIDPRLGGSGTNLQLRDPDEENDASTVIDLPFDFKYYSGEFSSLTVCTNGWAAFGDHHEIISSRNRRIPSGELVPAMLAPFWDELITTRNGGIFSYYDEENFRFIVEWSQMRKLGPAGNNEPIETFEIVLYDPEHRSGDRGDGDIIFQYLNVTDSQSCFQTWDTPFATVGIASPGRDTGLEYSYWRQLNPGAAPLQDRRAILFTTPAEYPKIYFRGIVTDAANSEPLEGAEVTDQYGVGCQTNPQGEFFLPIAFFGQNIVLIAKNRFYNDQTIADFDAEAGDTVAVRFALPKPSFTINRNSIEVVAHDDYPLHDTLLVENNGNGWLAWSLDVTELRLISRDSSGSSAGRSEVTDEVWLSVSPVRDTLAANERGVIVLTIDASSLVNGRYQSILEIIHNAEPGIAEIPITLDVSLAIPDDKASDIDQFKLIAAYPNPFNSHVNLAFTLPLAEFTRVEIIDLSGKVVEEIYSGELQRGFHNQVWNAVDVSAGIYLCRISSSQKTITTKLLLIK